MYHTSGSSLNAFTEHSNSNASFTRPRQIKENNLKDLSFTAIRNNNNIYAQHDDSRFEWEKLPLEVYETLVKYLDANSLMNLCESSSYIESRVLEPFSVLSFQKRERHWHKFCIENLDRSLVCKIFTSLMPANELGVAQKNLTKVTEEEKSNDGPLRCIGSWERVFYSYNSYWTLLTSGHCSTQRLHKLENKLKAEMLCVAEAEAETSDLTSSYLKKDLMKKRTGKYSWITRSGGGKIISNVMLPCPSNKYFNRINLVVTEGSENANCIHLSTLCATNSTDFFRVKTVHFPIKRNENGKNVLTIDRVLVSICSDCIITTPLLGGVTRKMSWPEERTEDGSLDDVEICSLLEVKENVIVMWPRPSTLLFFLMIALPGQEGYECRLLYTLRFDNMDILWDKVYRLPSHFLAVIQEFPGTTPRMSQHATELVLGKSEYFYHPSNPVYYGLQLVSPTHGVLSFKPSADSNEVIIENLEPIYRQKNSARYLSCMKVMQDPKCSGKGYGKYVFCSNTVIAVSWNAIEWVLGHLSFPTLAVGNAENAVTHVELCSYNEGLLLVVNQDILLAEMILLNNRNDLSEAEIAVKPLRIFKTTLASLCKEISNIELNFDNGQPFLFVVAKQHFSPSTDEKDEVVMKRIRGDFSFAIMRIEFNEDF